MNRKLLLSFIVAVGTALAVKAQRHELGVRFGMSNLVGDVGRTNYILQKPLSGTRISDYGIPFYGGAFYRFSFNPYQSVRFDLGYNNIQFKDRAAKEDYRSQRNYMGKNDVYESSLVFEYALFPINNEQEKGMLSPYIFLGVGAIMHDAPKINFTHDFRRDADGVAQAPLDELDFVSTPTYSTGKKVSMTVPFGVGLRYKFKYNWTVSLEAMFRPTTADQLDYSKILDKDVKGAYNADILSPNTNGSLLQSGNYYIVSKEREKEYLEKRSIGDTRNKDWMNSITLGVSYSFGRPPCYCD